MFKIKDKRKKIKGKNLDQNYPGFKIKDKRKKTKVKNQDK
jgi:hypothetical protein